MYSHLHSHSREPQPGSIAQTMHRMASCHADSSRIRYTRKVRAHQKHGHGLEIVYYTFIDHGRKVLPTLVVLLPSTSFTRKAAQTQSSPDAGHRRAIRLQLFIARHPTTRVQTLGLQSVNISCYNWRWSLQSSYPHSYFPSDEEPYRFLHTLYHRRNRESTIELPSAQRVLTQPQLETIGYTARAAAHNNTQSLFPYIVQFLLILLAPLFFAASIYSILGHLIYRINGDNISIVHPSIMTKNFVVSDALCFLIQGTGGGMLSQAKTQGAVDFGNTVVLVGLAVQIYVFAFFVKIAVSFQRDLRRHPGVLEQCVGFKWQRYFGCLHVICACMGVRNIYRIIEYAMGKVCSYALIVV